MHQAVEDSLVVSMLNKGCMIGHRAHIIREETRGAQGELPPRLHQLAACWAREDQQSVRLALRARVEGLEPTRRRLLRHHTTTVSSCRRGRRTAAAETKNRRRRVGRAPRAIGHALSVDGRAAKLEAINRLALVQRAALALPLTRRASSLEAERAAGVAIEEHVAVGEGSQRLAHDERLP